MGSNAFLLKFTDWHPAFQTLTNWLITRVWLSPPAIAFTQIVAMSLVLGWGLAEQRRLGAPRWLPWMVTLVIVLIPSNGLMVIALWKDVFYSISVIVFTILVFKITLSYGEWFQRHPVAWVYLGCTAALVGSVSAKWASGRFWDNALFDNCLSKDLETFFARVFYCSGIMAGCSRPG